MSEPKADIPVQRLPQPPTKASNTGSVPNPHQTQGDDVVDGLPSKPEAAVTRDSVSTVRPYIPRGEHPVASSNNGASGALQERSVERFQDGDQAVELKGPAKFGL